MSGQHRSSLFRVRRRAAVLVRRITGWWPSDLIVTRHDGTQRRTGGAA